jgi:hypothetical protein
MAKSMKPKKYYTEILSVGQKKLLGRIGPLMTQLKFYIGGGTAIALMLGHRKSIDLDWFTPENFGDANSYVNKFKDINLDLKNIEITDDILHATANRVRISMLEYRYQLLQPTKIVNNYGCELGSLDDLACMKLSAVAQRGSKKDFIDIYAIMKKHISLNQMIELYKRKYNNYDIAPVMYGLNYFDDADKERTPNMIWKVDWRNIKNEIKKAVRELIP